jgi:hypothetical protein
MAPRGWRKAVGVAEMPGHLGLSTATVCRALNGHPAVRGGLTGGIRAQAEAGGHDAKRRARPLSARSSHRAGSPR